VVGEGQYVVRVLTISVVVVAVALPYVVQTAGLLLEDTAVTGPAGADQVFVRVQGQSVIVKVVASVTVYVLLP
jgi:hypothetical protein